jgi:catechol 2,3-dioxygenase-like lactoylglutathione lyase family enzyme
MAEVDQRPGAVYWIDHFVVGTADLDRWVEWAGNVLGAKDRWTEMPPGNRFGEFLLITPYCHFGGFVQKDPLPPMAELGKGLPRWGFYIQKEDVEEHLRRLDQFGVNHSDAIRTSEQGEAGTVIYFEDPDQNQYELWAPDRLPEGAMDGAGPMGIGRISSGTYESRDLDRTAAFYSRYCGLDRVYSSDIPSDTLVFRMVGGSRLVFKQVESLGLRTGGAARFRGLHNAFAIRDTDFISNYKRVWDELSEWDYDQQLHAGTITDPGALPARTGQHGSAAGRKWKEMYGRGDQIYDWDTNSFHFVGGVSDSPTMATYEGRYMEDYVEAFMKEKESAAR